MRGRVLSVIVRQLIKNSRCRTRNCTQTNATSSTEIGRKVLYAAREESQFYLVWFCCPRFARNCTQTNGTSSTEIGRKVLYTAREESQFHLVWFCCPRFARNCTQINATYSTEIGRKVLYATREESRFHLVWFCCRAKRRQQIWPSTWIAYISLLWYKILIYAVNIDIFLNGLWVSVFCGYHGWRYGCWWVSIGIYGWLGVLRCLWVPVCVALGIWVSMGFYGYLWVSLGVMDLRVFISMYGCLWVLCVSMSIYRSL